MSDRVLVMLSCGTDNPNRATRALFFAMVANKKGREVAAFLLDEGAYLAKRGTIEHLQAATGDSAATTCTISRSTARRFVCTPRAVARQAAEADLVKGARRAKGDEPIDPAVGSAVLNF